MKTNLKIHKRCVQSMQRSVRASSQIGNLLRTLFAIGIVASVHVVVFAQQPTLKLPFPNGYRSVLVQQAGDCFSHCDTFTRHDIDLDTPNSADDVVVAAADGVAYTIPDGGANSFGNHVNIDHGPVDPNNPSGDHYFTIYGHLKTFLVKSGQRVSQGQPIGMEGCTGFCKGDHVHFGLHRGNPQSNAINSTSITANEIIARDVTNNGQFTTFTSDQFVEGRTYEANSTYPTDCTNDSAWKFPTDSRCWFFGQNGGASTLGFNEPGAWIIKVGADPNVLSPPLSVETSSISAIEITMASLASDRAGELFFATDASPSFSPTKSKQFDVINNGSYQTYTLSLAGNSSWTGRLTRLRLDPVGGGNGSEVVGLLSIRLIMKDGSSPTYEGNYDEADCVAIAGWVRDTSNPGTRLGVVVTDDTTGAVVGSATADIFRQDLVDAGKGDGKYGFSIAMPTALKDGQNHLLRVKVLNSNYTLSGTPKLFNSTTQCGPTSQPPNYEGFHDYVDCNNLGGWVWDKNNPNTRLGVTVTDDNTGAVVATGTADQLRQDLVSAGKGDGKHGFTIPVPASLKDGQNHTLRVRVTGATYNLNGTPKLFNSTSLCGSAATVDLIVSDVSAPASANPGGQISISATVVNQGGASAGSFRLGLYVSNDTNITTSDTFLTSCSISGLSPGASATCSGNVIAPQASGTYFVGGIADDTNVIAESNENNNSRGSGPIAVGSVPTIGWEFNTLNNFEGWSAINISAAAVHDGILFIDPAGSDPNIVSPNTSLSASAYRFVVVRMASNAIDPFGNVYFKTQSENFYSADKRVEFTVSNCSLCTNASFVTYTVNMTGNAKWTGTITGIRIDPANDGKAGTNTDSVGFDFVRITP